MTNLDEALFLDWGKEALTLECEAIRRVANEFLGSTFVGACAAVLQSSGRVVTTGLGKSGHVARKVASTLASTGTPSHFLHPSEALHGDFGMVSRDDILLAFAYGGETSETIEVAKFARRLEVPVITITGKRESSLAQLADYSILGSVEREADPHNLAPTSSSTVAMAIGDALAVTVMRARGFSEADFAVLHPGGSLGRRLSTVADHVVAEFSKVGPDADFHRVLEGITRFNHGITAVVDDQGRLLGAVSDGDLRRACLRADENLLQLTAHQMMTPTPKTIASNVLAVDALNAMKNITQLFVTDAASPGSLLGLVRLHDLLAAKIV